MTDIDEREEQLAQRVLEGQQCAEETLDNPSHVRARVQIEGALIDTLRRTKHDESELRDEIWRKLQIVEWFEKIYRRTVNDGKLAEKELLDRKNRPVRRVV